MRYCLAICSDNFFLKSLSTCWYSLIAVFNFRSTLPTWGLFLGSPDSLCCLMALIRAPKLRYNVIVSELRASISRFVCVPWLASGSSIARDCRRRSRSRLRSMESMPRSMSRHSLRMALGSLEAFRFDNSTSPLPTEWRSQFGGGFLKDFNGSHHKLRCLHCHMHLEIVQVPSMYCQFVARRDCRPLVLVHTDWIVHNPRIVAARDWLHQHPVYITVILLINQPSLSNLEHETEGVLTAIANFSC